jgi:hypothetical protein
MNEPAISIEQLCRGMSWVTLRCQVDRVWRTGVSLAPVDGFWVLGSGGIFRLAVGERCWVAAAHVSVSYMLAVFFGAISHVIFVRTWDC